MSERISIPVLRQQVEKRRKFAHLAGGLSLSADEVAALVEAVDAARRFERAYQDSLGAADAHSADHRDTCQLALVARLSKFDFGESA